MNVKTWLEEVDRVFYDCTNQVEDLILNVSNENTEVRSHPSWDQVVSLKNKLEQQMIFAYEELEEKFRNQ